MRSLRLKFENTRLQNQNRYDWKEKRLNSTFSLNPFHIRTDIEIKEEIPSFYIDKDLY